MLFRPTMQAEYSAHCLLALPITHSDAVLALWTAFSQGHSLCLFLIELNDTKLLVRAINRAS